MYTFKITFQLPVYVRCVSFSHFACSVWLVSPASLIQVHGEQRKLEYMNMYFAGSDKWNCNSPVDFMSTHSSCSFSKFGSPIANAVKVNVVPSVQSKTRLSSECWESVTRQITFTSGTFYSLSSYPHCHRVITNRPSVTNRPNINLIIIVSDINTLGLNSSNNPPCHYFICHN